MTSVAETLAAIGRTAPWSKAAGWDPVGLRLGDPGRSVRRAAVCHEVTEEIAELVAADPVDLLVTYHPLLFRPTTRMVAGRSSEGRALRLIEAGVALAVAHTNFDVAAGGAADALADVLELQDPTGFAPLDGPDSVKISVFAPTAAAERVAEAMAAAGAGVIGNYTHCSFRTDGTGTFVPEAGAHPTAGVEGALNREEEVRVEMVAPRRREAAIVAALVAAHPYEEPAFDVYDRRGDAAMIGRVGDAAAGTTLASLAAWVEERLGGVVRVAGDPAAPLERIAVVPGAGSDFLTDAAAAGADAIVTGDVSHHRARSALDRGMVVIDPGHIATERPGVRRLVATVSAAVEDTVDLTDHDPSPWKAP